MQRFKLERQEEEKKRWYTEAREKEEQERKDMSKKKRGAEMVNKIADFQATEDKRLRTIPGERMKMIKFISKRDAASRGILVWPFRPHSLS